MPDEVDLAQRNLVSGIKRNFPYHNGKFLP